MSTFTLNELTYLSEQRIGQLIAPVLIGHRTSVWSQCVGAYCQPERVTGRHRPSCNLLQRNAPGIIWYRPARPGVVF
ncbi:MAG: hypothetical protein H0U22_00870 [Geodermatophilaceae bacterium]|nr:hypothetical protein [Geodermatophilaceae bacterium]